MDGSTSQWAGRWAVLSRGLAFPRFFPTAGRGHSLSFLPVSQPSCQLSSLDQRWSHNLALAGITALGSGVFGVSDVREEGASDPPGGSSHLCVDLFLAEGEEVRGCRAAGWRFLVRSSRASLSRML